MPASTQSTGACRRGGGAAMRQPGRLLRLIVALVALWQLAYWAMGETVLASPRDTVMKLAALIQTRPFRLDIWETFRAFADALVLSLIGGIALGVALGLHRASGTVAEPILVTL